MECSAMSGPDELEMCAAVKLPASVPLAAAMEALKSKVVGSKQDKTISYMFVATLLIRTYP